jgi:hypothetical protein
MNTKKIASHSPKVRCCFFKQYSTEGNRKIYSESFSNSIIYRPLAKCKWSFTLFCNTIVLYGKRDIIDIDLLYWRSKRLTSSIKYRK